MKHIKTGIISEGIDFADTSDKKSGFFDLPIIKKCECKEHYPPNMISIPQGKGYRHICPCCGKETIVIPQQIIL